MAILAEPSSTLGDRQAAFAQLKERLHEVVARAPQRRSLPTAIPGLDHLLGGGFPCGSVVALEGSGLSAGRWGVVASLLAQATRRGLAAVIDDGALYPPALAQAGVCLDRLLIVPAQTALRIARAADILLRSRICRIVVMPVAALRAAVWARLAGLAHRMDALLVVVSAQATQELAIVTGLRLRCVLERAIVQGARGVWCRLEGYDLRAELHKHKRSAPGAHARLRAFASEAC